ncbi:endolytic transglycosylase MltG [Patescibacteria group bacterium]|nr:endolytic transglycosylase MltG [Patescibacteria group bacterium]
MNKSKLTLIIITIVLLAGLFFSLQLTYTVNSKNSDSEQIVFLQIESGQGVNEISFNLKEAGLIKSQFAFEVYLWFSRIESELKAGEYQFAQNLSIKEITNYLVDGSNSNESEIVIIEGWRLTEIADYLEEKGVANSSDFLKAAAVHDSREIIPDGDYDFLSDRSSQADLEGYLFPDTYRVFKDTAVAEIIKKMLDNFDVKLTDELRQEIADQGKTIFEIVTLASVLEKELRTDEDRKMAADLFYRRIEAGIPMQSDATVNYVTGKSLLQPSYVDTQAESLYNTYLHRGLPPGPISNPSLSAIEAVIYPSANEYYYYLNKPDGTTVFSRTLEEHNSNKFKYLSD